MSRRILIIPDKFKGSLAATEAAEAIASGWAAAWPEDSIDRIPMSDGGDGFGEVMAGSLGFAKRLFRRGGGAIPDAKLGVPAGGDGVVAIQCQPAHLPAVTTHHRALQPASFGVWERRAGRGRGDDESEKRAGRTAQQHPFVLL